MLNALLIALSFLVGLMPALVSAAAPQSEWLLIGRNPENQHHSPLDQINAGNVGRLGLAWSVAMPSRDGLVGVPLIADGVIYESGSRSIVYANDLRTGKLLWTFNPHVTPPPGKIVPAWGTLINRGLALWKNTLYVGTGDCRLVAIDRARGVERWEAQACDPNDNYTITGPPCVGSGEVFIGNANADTGLNRGFIEAYDARTGKRLWRFYTIPGNPANGFESHIMAMAAKTWGQDYWKKSGGGSVWHAITYDPVTKLLYFGTDGASPVNPNLRGKGNGDELFTTSILAVNARTGAYVWHYQTTPHDGWNYDATMPIVVAELSIDGKKRRVVMEAPKNGFFYVLDAYTGKLLRAKNYLPVTWASRIDMKTGRPVLTPGAQWWLHAPEPDKAVFPSALGAHSWQPMSYSRETGLVYVPTMEQPMSIVPGNEVAVGGAEANFYLDLNKDHKFVGGLVAWDPIKQIVRWHHVVGPPMNGGVLSTSGNLVFQGTSDGHFRAYRANDGKLLWDYRLAAGIYAAPVTVKVDSTQLVIVPTGSGSSASVITYSLMGGITHGPSRLLAFELGGTAKLPPGTYHPTEIPKPNMSRPDAQLAARGRAVFYEAACDLCHGYNAIGAQGASPPDLRRAAVVTTPLFARIVRGGLLAKWGMPSFADIVKADQIDALRAYIVQQAWAGYDAQQQVTRPQHH